MQDFGLEKVDGLGFHVTPPEYYERIRSAATESWAQMEADPEHRGLTLQLFKQVTQGARHVISELLQNADDAGASVVRLGLEDGAFFFEHNGEDFTEDQFKSLCRFGYSNKRVLRTIGFRGIGFKSTFSLGPEVRLTTSSLAVSFLRTQFKVPVWRETGDRGSGLGTRIEVPVEDEHRLRAIQDSISAWQETPTSLLFMNHVRALDLNGTTIRWVRLDDGPVPNSYWLAREEEPEKRALLLESEEEAFPDEAVGELADERLLGFDEAGQFPPCRVQLVLGVESRLYSVLPAGVDTRLPFAVNAPFVQSPSRESIRPPETSATNRWLLDRAGRLAAQCVQAWLSNKRLPLDRRAHAYELVPDVDRSDASIGGVCATRVELAFQTAVPAGLGLLSVNGRLLDKTSCIAVPPDLVNLWSLGEGGHPLDVEGREPLASEVSEASRQKLVNWAWLQELTRPSVLDAARTRDLPRPKTWAALLQFWKYVLDALPNYGPGSSAQTLRIFPAQGSDVLLTAERLVRLDKGKLLNSDDDWDFLAAWLRVLNPNWTRFLSEERRKLNDRSPDNLPGLLDAAENLLRRAGLAGASDAASTVEKVCREFFTGHSRDIADCVRLAHIAAKLDVTAKESMRWVTRDRKLRPASETLFDEDGFLAATLPPDSCDATLLHEAYMEGFVSCSRDEWRRWVASGKSGVGRFPLPTRTSRWFWGLAEATSFARTRGLSESLSLRYRSQRFIADDWDFAEDHWEAWERAVSDGVLSWHDLLERILGANAPAVLRSTRLEIHQLSQAQTQASATHERLRPAWVERFRELPCLLDTWGTPRLPRELLRRTESTEPLLEVEPFVERRLDTDANRELLDALGVGSTPLGPERLLDRLRALAEAENPPLDEVDKLYRQLDKLASTCPTDQLNTLRAAFEEEDLVLATDSTWHSKKGVFIGAGELEASEIPVVRPTVSYLTLWQRIGVPDRPTLATVLDWLGQLPRSTALPAPQADRVRSLIGRYPAQVWGAGDWLSLASEWVPVESFSYRVTKLSEPPWSHLHLAVRRKTADCRTVAQDDLEAGPMRVVPLLAEHLEERPTSSRSNHLVPTRPEWLIAVSSFLQRVRIGDQVDAQRVHVSAERLGRSSIVVVEHLATVPTLDGTPVGTSRTVDALWLGEEVLIRDMPTGKLARLVPEEIHRTFGRLDIKAALDYSFERPAAQIAAYFNENFELAPEADGPRVAPGDEQQAMEHTPDAAQEESAADAAVARPEPTRGDFSSQAAPSDVPEREPTHPAELDRPTLTDSDEPDLPGSLQDVNAKPPRTPQPDRLGLMARWALARGMTARLDGTFSGAGGETLERHQGDILPWVLYRPELPPRRFWAREQCLEVEPCEVTHEVWEAVRKHPAENALIFTDPAGQPVEYSGEMLEALVESRQVTVYPASYRLVKS